MSEIKFTCRPFSEVSKSIKSGSDQRIALHMGLREALGDDFDIIYCYQTDYAGLDTNPFEPDRVMLATAEGKWFAVYTDYGRIISVGRHKYLTRFEKDVYLPEGASCIHGKCLSNGILTMDTLYLPSRVYLGKSCFEGICAKRIEYPKDFTAFPTSIPERAFAESDLTEIEIWDGVYGISKEAFLNCRNLKTVSLPRSLIHIGESAFSGCAEGLRIIFRGTREEWEALSKAEKKISSTMHYDNSRVGYDHADIHRTSAWIDFDGYTLDFTES